MVDLVGWAVIAASAALVAGTWFGLRDRAAPRICDACSGLGGIGVGAGGLLLVSDVGVVSWVLTPALLGVGLIVHRRLLFAGEGPLRT